MTTFTDPPNVPVSWRMLAIRGGTTLAVAIVVCLGVWQAGIHTRRGSTAAVVQQRSAAPAPIQVRSAPASVLPAATTAPHVAQGTQPPRLLLVSSAEAVSFLRAMVAAAEAYAGQPYPWAGDTVLLVGQETSAKDVQAAFGFENEFRAQIGLPRVQVLDLR